jgi:putative MATE family efflux protein
MSGVVDTAVMGRYATVDLAAVSGASAIFDIFAGIVLASLVAHQILAARFAGRQDPAGIARSLRSSAVLCGGLAGLLTLACLLGGEQLSGLVTGRHPELRHIGAQYLAARAPTLLILVAFTLVTAVFNAYRKPRYALVAAIAVNVVNLLLDWLLVYGPGPFPRLGAVGNGLATTLSWLVGAGCLLIAARRFGLIRLLRSGGAGKPADFVTSIPRLAWPAVVSSGLDYASVAIFFAIVGGLGTSALAGSRVAFEIILFLFGLGMSFAVAGRILIGRAAGADDIRDVTGSWRASQLVLLAGAAPIAVALAVFPGPAARIFTSFPAVVTAAATAMPLVAVCVPLMAWTLANTAALRALGHTRTEMYANLIAALAVQLPLAWVLIDPSHLGITGAYLAVTAYWATRAVLTELLCRRSVRAEAHRIAANRRSEPGPEPPRLSTPRLSTPPSTPERVSP